MDNQQETIEPLRVFFILTFRIAEAKWAPIKLKWAIESFRPYKTLGWDGIYSLYCCKNERTAEAHLIQFLSQVLFWKSFPSLGGKRG